MLKLGVFPGGIGVLGEHAHDPAGPDDVDVEDGDLVAAPPVAHDPGGGLRADPREGQQRIPELHVAEGRLVHAA